MGGRIQTTSEAKIVLIRECLKRGMAQKAIADHLEVGEGTVRKYKSPEDHAVVLALRREQRKRAKLRAAAKCYRHATRRCSTPGPQHKTKRIDGHFMCLVHEAEYALAKSGRGK